MLYKRLFDFVVERINHHLTSTSSFAVHESPPRQIGILDIYGFEQLRLNSFEQLCINLANERLQEFFREKVILAEQDLYHREGLPEIEISMTSSVDLLNAIEGCFGVLDKHGQMLAKNVRTTDERFTEDVQKSVHGEYFQRVKRGRKSVGGDLDAKTSFSVTHYAGEVCYSTQNWLDKNNSLLSTECEMLIVCSNHSVVKELTSTKAEGRGAMGTSRYRRGSEDSSFFDDELSPRSGSGAKTSSSVAQKYVVDLSLLMQTLNRCNLFYIRCFKPNNAQRPGRWQGGLVCWIGQEVGDTEIASSEPTHVSLQFFSLPYSLLSVGTYVMS